MRGFRLGLAVLLLAAHGGIGASEPTVTVVAGGDCFPGHHLDRLMRSGVDPFSRLKPFLQSADLAVANLECALTDSGRPARGKKFTFRAPPERAELLAQSGLDVLGLANNHAMDFGAAGLTETASALSSAGLGFCGAGRNSASARLPVFREARGVRVAFLCYNRTLPKSFWASPDGPGTAFAREEHVSADVREAVRSADIVIVCMHGGREKVRELRDYQRSVAKAALGAGADLFVGAHPHVAQGIERIGAGVAAYSLGDFVFGGKWDRREDGLLLRAVFNKSGLVKVEAFALRASIARTGGAPFLADDPAAISELERVRELSAELGTELKLGPSPEGLTRLSLELERGEASRQFSGQEEREEKKHDQPG